MGVEGEDVGELREGRQVEAMATRGGARAEPLEDRSRLGDGEATWQRESMLDQVSECRAQEGERRWAKEGVVEDLGISRTSVKGT